MSSQYLLEERSIPVPCQLDPWQLPSVWLEDRNQLPSIVAVYFVFDGYDEIQYIGQSMKLKARILSHNKLRIFKNLYSARIAWLEISDIKVLNQSEQLLIQYFNPPLNVRNKLRYEEAWLGSFGEKKVICKLNQLIANKGLNQWDVSSATGIHWLTISQLYRNKFIKIDKPTATKLCQYFAIGIEGLLEIVPESTRNA